MNLLRKNSCSKQESVFGAFSQAEESTTRRFGGTGLGLTISRRFVEMMGGRLWVDSVPGEGTVILTTLVVLPKRQISLKSS